LPATHGLRRGQHSFAGLRQNKDLIAGDRREHRVPEESKSTINNKSAFAVRRRAMTKPAFLTPALVTIVLLICIISTGAQMKDVYIPGVPAQPEPMDPDHGKTGPNEPKLQRRIDPVKLQRDADDLARRAQTIPTDIANISRGTLPKDTIQKLKEIEKLSKRLGSELNP
jgi:hypothetical protein